MSKCSRAALPLLDAAKNRIVPLLLVVSVFGIPESGAYTGQLLATYDYEISRFLMHPSQPIMYASVTNLNSVVAIDTKTLKVVSTTFVGSNPTGMAVSNDGSRLYVANSSSNFIGVVDTKTGAFVKHLAVPELPRDVEVGHDGRLYVLGDSSLMQRDPETGATVGGNVGPSFLVYSGEIAISRDKTRLYYGDYGLSPASLYQFDVSTGAATLLWESPHGGTSGSNGQDLGVSHDGSFVSYAAGFGQVGYSIAKYRTSDMLIEGTFNTGAYPREIAFSPDDAVAYTVHTAGAIDLWDTKSFLSLGSIGMQGEAYELEVDSTGRYLFAAVGGFSSPYGLRVFDTGRIPPIPEPSTGILAALGFVVTLSAARRRTRVGMQWSTGRDISKCAGVAI